MVEFTVAEVSNQLNTSTQNTYKKLDFLISKGLAYRDEQGKSFIYESGLNYLRETTKKTQVADNEKNNTNSNENISATLITTLNEQIANKDKEIEYWKKMYERKDVEYVEFVNKTTMMLDVAKNEVQVATENLNQAVNRNKELLKETNQKDAEIYELQNKKKWYSFWKS